MCHHHKSTNTHTNQGEAISFRWYRNAQTKHIHIDAAFMIKKKEEKDQNELIQFVMNAENVVSQIMIIINMRISFPVVRVSFLAGIR